MDKKESYYFSHDSNAITDTKILNMRADYGLEGYGLFWCILEMMRNTENYKLECNKNTYRAIKILSATTIDVEKYINDCINDYKLFVAENDLFYSKSFLQRMQIKEEKSKIAKDKAKKRWDKAEGKSDSCVDEVDTALQIKCNNNAIALQQHCNSNAIKEKERKEKENKEKQIQQLDSCVDEVVVEKNVFKFYEDNFTLLTPYSTEILMHYEEKLSGDLVIYAMQIAVEQNSKNIAYVKAILENWKNDNIKTLQQAKEKNESFKKAQKDKNTKKFNNYVQREYENLDNLYANLGGSNDSK